MITDKAKVRASVGAEKVPDDVFTEKWEAAEGYVADRVTYPTTNDAGEEIPPPAALVEAVVLLTARFIARRNSPDGFVGLGDLGVAQVPVSDRDVNRLIAPWRVQVIG